MSPQLLARLGPCTFKAELGREAYKVVHFRQHFGSSSRLTKKRKLCKLYETSPSMKQFPRMGGTGESLAARRVVVGR